MNLNFNDFPVLHTERLVLRKISSDDVENLFLLRSNQDVMHYLDRPLAASKDDAASLINKITDSLNANEGITWGMAIRSQPALIGTIGYWRILKEHYRAEIGYMLHPDHQGKGLMQEAFDAVIHYGFKNMSLHSIEANVNPGNAASIKILEKNKFTREAWFRENYYYNGKFLDSFIYSRLADNHSSGNP